MAHLKAFLKDQRGATAIEYALIAAAIAVVIVVAVNQAGVNARDGAYTDIGTLF